MPPMSPEGTAIVQSVRAVSALHGLERGARGGRVGARAPRTTSVTAARNASMVASDSSPMFDDLDVPVGELALGAVDDEAALPSAPS